MSEAKQRDSMQIILNDHLFMAVYINILICFVVNDSYLCAETIGDTYSIRITGTHRALRLAKQ